MVGFKHAISHTTAKHSTTGPLRHTNHCYLQKMMTLSTMSRMSVQHQRAPSQGHTLPASQPENSNKLTNNRRCYQKYLWTEIRPTTYDWWQCHTDLVRQRKHHVSKSLETAPFDRTHHVRFPISFPFTGQKLSILTDCTSIWGPAGATTLQFRRDLRQKKKLRVHGLVWTTAWCNLLDLDLVILIEHRLVTDRRTDRQTTTAYTALA